MSAASASLKARRAAGAPPCYTVPPGARGEGGRAATDDVAVIHDVGEAASAAAITKALEVAAAGAQALLIARGHPVLRDGLETNLTATLAAEARAQRRAGSTEDAVEGAMAFLQKRKAEFKGA